MTYVINNLAKNQEALSRVPSNAPCSKCGSTVPMLKCNIYPQYYEDKDGFLFDRRGDSCCEDWEFETGDPYTVLSFFGYTGVPNPWTVGDIPEFLPMHNQFIFAVETYDESSHYLMSHTLTWWEQLSRDAAVVAKAKENEAHQMESTSFHQFSPLN